MSISAQFSGRFGAFDLTVEFETPERGITGVLGPSGCGKTTLLRCLAGLERATGRLSIGMEVWQDRTVFTPAHCRPVGYVFQEASLFEHLTVRENIEYGWRRTHPSKRTFHLDRAVALFGLEHLLARRPDRLSGGERQRVAMARALLSSPRLLLMDEPLSSLDTKSKEDLLPFLERIHGELEIPVFYVSHSPDEVARLADHLLLMKSGNVTAVGAVQELLTNLDLPLAFGDDAEALVYARVVSHDDHHHLTNLIFSGGELVVPRVDLRPGATVRVRIRARDVSLALDQPLRTSILNVLGAEVVEICSAIDMSQVMVKLRVGGEFLLSRITRKSAEALDLKPGVKVHLMVKSVSLLS